MSVATSLSRWELPTFGGVAAEDVPAWIVEAMLLGVLTVNRLGGFTLDDARGTSCMAGDIVVRQPDGSITFEKQEQAIAA
jgi:hypothetical protein